MGEINMTEEQREVLARKGSSRLHKVVSGLTSWEIGIDRHNIGPALSGFRHKANKALDNLGKAVVNAVKKKS